MSWLILAIEKRIQEVGHVSPLECVDDKFCIKAFMQNQGMHGDRQLQHTVVDLSLLSQCVYRLRSG